MRIYEALDLLGYESCTYQGDPNAQYNGVAYRYRRDSRARFFVLFDRHWPEREKKKYKQSGTDSREILQEVVRKGATHLICNYEHQGSPILEGLNCIFVDNTYRFLFQLIQATVDNSSTSYLIGITGSVGKSTTKTMLVDSLRSIRSDDAILSPSLGENVYPSILANLSRIHEYDGAVLEVAGSCFARFKKSGFNPKFDVSIVTSIGEAHLDYLGSLRGVAEYKSGIFAPSDSGGVAVINIDAPFAGLLLQRAAESGRIVVTYGAFPNADVRLKSYDPATDRVEAQIFDVDVQYPIGSKGRHMALNSLAVLAALAIVEPDQWQKAVPGLASFQALPGRGVRWSGTVNGVDLQIIDESYNANPSSMAATIHSLLDLPLSSGYRRVVVLGDMLELGSNSSELHLGLVPLLSDPRIDEVHLFGERMYEVCVAARTRGNDRVRHWRTLEKLESFLRSESKDGDVILVKGSQATGLNRLVSSLKGDE